MTPGVTFWGFFMITYRAINTVNGKFYIGSTTNFESRKGQHLRCKRNLPFHNALRKNSDAFEWEVFYDTCDDPVLEQALLDMWFGKECCYNLNPVAGRPPVLKGHKFSEETLKKRSATRTGVPSPLRGRPLSPEHKLKISVSHTGKPGLSGEANPNAKLSKEQREEIKNRYTPRSKGQSKSNASALAEEYGVHRKTIYAVVNEGKTN